MAHMVNSTVDGVRRASTEENAAPHSGSTHAGHPMTPSMIHVTTQHLWFTLVGIAIALFKFIDDASVWRKGFVPYLWPSGMLLLGSLLALYTETV